AFFGVSAPATGSLSSIVRMREELTYELTFLCWRFVLAVVIRLLRSQSFVRYRSGPSHRVRSPRCARFVTRVRRRLPCQRLAWWDHLQLDRNAIQQRQIVFTQPLVLFIDSRQLRIARLSSSFSRG